MAKTPFSVTAVTVLNTIAKRWKQVQQMNGILCSSKKE